MADQLAEVESIRSYRRLKSGTTGSRKLLDFGSIFSLGLDFWEIRGVYLNAS